MSNQHAEIQAHDSVLQLNTISRTYMQGERALEILKNIQLTIHPGELIALVGPSGSGKSTLLQIAGLLDTPTSGEVLIAGKNMSTASDRTHTRTRRKHIGFIYQFHYLQAEFSALENVVLPQLIAGIKKPEATLRAEQLLEQVGLKTRMHHRPGTLSGGEQQRVAIARALANSPSLILADEPTGNLDPTTGETIFSMFKKLAKEKQLSVLMATHNMQLAKRMDRIVQMHEGSIRETT